MTNLKTIDAAYAAHNATAKHSARIAELNQTRADLGRYLMTPPPSPAEVLAATGSWGQMQEAAIQYWIVERLMQTGGVSAVDRALKVELNASTSTYLNGLIKSTQREAKALVEAAAHLPATSEGEQFDDWERAVREGYAEHLIAAQHSAEMLIAYSTLVPKANRAATLIAPTTDVPRLTMVGSRITDDLATQQLVQRARALSNTITASQLVAIASGQWAGYEVAPTANLDEIEARTVKFVDARYTNTVDAR